MNPADWSSPFHTLFSLRSLCTSVGGESLLSVSGNRKHKPVLWFVDLTWAVVGAEGSAPPADMVSVTGTFVSADVVGAEGPARPAAGVSVTGAPVFADVVGAEAPVPPAAIDGALKPVGVGAEGPANYLVKLK